MWRILQNCIVQQFPAMHDLKNSNSKIIESSQISQKWFDIRLFQCTKKLKVESSFLFYRNQLVAVPIAIRMVDAHDSKPACRVHDPRVREAGRVSSGVRACPDERRFP